MDSRKVAPSLPYEHRGAPLKLPQGCPKSALGLPKDCLWIASRLPKDRAKTAYDCLGVPLDSLTAALGLPKTLKLLPESLEAARRVP